MTQACASLLLLASGALVLHAQHDVHLLAAAACLAVSLRLATLPR